MLERFAVLNRLWSFSVLALVSLLAINAIQSYSSISELVMNESRASNTKSMLRAVKDVYSSVQDAELGLRGFLISGKADQLRPYFISLNSIKENITTLKGIQSELPEQEPRIRQLEKVIEERLHQMTQNINQKSVNVNSDRVASRNMLISHESMIRIRALISEMEEAEFELLNQQYLQARESRSKVKATIIIANGIGLVLVIVIGVLVSRAIKRQKTEAAWLEAMVEKRTRELKHFSEELQRSNGELQDFAFVASHDLQEPLRKIRAFGDRLASRYSEALGDGADYVYRMQNAAERMSKLIEDLLTFSRVTTRSNPIESVDLNETMKEILDTLEIAIEEKGAEINVEALPTVEADSSQMKQLFQNLVGNALKFTRPGVTPKISVRVAETQNTDGKAGSFVKWFRIEVEDNGIGFDEKYLEKIFTPFQRLHGREQYEGTGIGLAICRRIVQRHQGELWASSELDAGTTFIIDLPAYQSDKVDTLTKELIEYEF